MNANDKIGDHMTPCPHTVEANSTVLEALKKMEENNIRHLPVVKGESVIGLLSEREIKRYETLMDTTRTPVVDVMIENPYTANKVTPIGEVLNVMAQNKFGSAVVLGNGGHIVGIFTTTDALQLLADKIS